MPAPVGDPALVEAQYIPMVVFASNETAVGHRGSPVSGFVFNKVTSVTPPPPPPPVPKSYGPDMIEACVPCPVVSSISAVRYQ